MHAVRNNSAQSEQTKYLMVYTGAQLMHKYAEWCGCTTTLVNRYCLCLIDRVFDGALLQIRYTIEFKTSRWPGDCKILCVH